MSDEKAERIRNKISASQARSRGDAAPRKANTASPKAGSASRQRATGETTFIERAMSDHPLALLAGSVVLGAIAASLAPRAWGSKLGSRMLGLATVAGELGVTYGAKAWDAASESARTGQEKLEDLGEVLADQGTDARRKAIELGMMAGKRAIELAGVAAKSARDAGDGARKAIVDLSDRARH